MEVEGSEMQGKVIVLLRTSSTARAPVYRHLREAGVVLVLVHPVRPATAFDGVFHHHLLHDTNDVAALQPALKQFLAERALIPDAVISFDEYAVYPAAVVAQSMGCRAIPLSPEKLRVTNVKSLFRERCAKEGIASPVATVLTRPPAGLHDLQEHIQRVLGTAGLTFPVVLKPCPGAGSLFTRLCNNVEEVRDQALTMWNVFKTHADVKHFEAVLGPAGVKEMQIVVEEYIGGQEIDVDCCVENGKIVFFSISDNFEVRPPFFVEEGGLCPSSLPSYEQQEVRQLFEQVIALYGEELHGVLHFEAKYDFQRRRAYVIEVNCRLGSAETNTMIRTCYRGLQLGESLVRCALGLPVTRQLLRHYPTEQAPVDGCYPHTCCCASVNIYPVAEGVLLRAEVPVMDKSLVDYSVSAEPGALVAPPPKAFYLLSWMVARGATASEAKAAIERLAANFVQEISVAQ
ncbi:biotin carboxylase [Trypanosoma grayi]|uniref:biotin carboxylase n=1 Tax=Trypanosoma grayi TaxID=71804 RepID=UPI0004F48A6E|nr:biotin carboxylase [Trypanosoma grayi]KEG11284.1 biotin carboxylase [Trypanosoma grayi]